MKPARVYDLTEARRLVGCGFEPRRAMEHSLKRQCGLCGDIGHDARQCNTPAGAERRERRMRELRDELHALAAKAPKHAVITAIKAIKRCELLAEARALAAKLDIPYLNALAQVTKEADRG